MKRSSAQPRPPFSPFLKVAVFRGVNLAATSKLPPFAGVPALAALDALPGRGVNVARVLVMWEALEPVRGTYNATYLDSIASTVDKLTSLNILSLLDFHQDGFARALARGCGDGFPAWAVPAAAAALVDGTVPANGDPGGGGKARCGAWLRAALGDAATRAAWAGFYADDGGVRASFVAAWAHVAARFAGHPGVLGYDILNEPLPTSASAVAALHRDAAAAIRAVDRDALLVFSAPIMSSGGAPAGVRAPAGVTNAALGVHYYPPPNTATPPALAGAAAALTAWSAEAAAAGVPLFVGEYGAEPGPAAPDAAAYIAGFSAALDSGWLSGTQWAWTPPGAWSIEGGDGWNGESFSVTNAVGAPRANWPLRPCPVAMAGKPIGFAAGEAQRRVVAAWAPDAAITAPTVLFAPVAWFGGRVRVEASPGLRCRHDAALLNVVCERRAGTGAGAVATVCVRRAAA